MAVKILRLKSKEMEEKSYHRGVTMQISLMGGGEGGYVNLGPLIASHTLLQSHTKFNRFLKTNFLTFYSYSYYNSMF